MGLVWLFDHVVLEKTVPSDRDGFLEELSKWARSTPQLAGERAFQGAECSQDLLLSRKRATQEPPN